MKKLYFDLDGTVANLYGEKKWLEKLRNEEKGLFLNLKPLYDMNVITDLVDELIEMDWEINVITWTPMFCSDEYHKQVTEEKEMWIKNLFPCVSNIACQRYGEPKQNAPIKRAQEMILIDDNKEVCEMWNTEKRRKSIITNGSDLIEILEKLVHKSEIERLEQK